MGGGVDSFEMDTLYVVVKEETGVSHYLCCEGL